MYKKYDNENILHSALNYFKLILLIYYYLTNIVVREESLLNG